VGSPSLPDLGVPSPVSGLGEGEAVYIFVAR